MFTNLLIRIHVFDLIFFFKFQAIDCEGSKLAGGGELHSGQVISC